MGRIVLAAAIDTARLGYLPRMTAIRIEGLVKRFRDTAAVSDVNLEIPSGSLFFLLGPSACASPLKQ